MVLTFLSLDLHILVVRFGGVDALPPARRVMGRDIFVGTAVVTDDLHLRVRNLSLTSQTSQITVMKMENVPMMIPAPLRPEVTGV